MSGNTRAESGKADRRVQKTRDRLGDALVALILEKPFDEIRVQDVLDRAGVARSTFYEHFRDMHDLFLSDVEDFLESLSTRLTRTAESSDRVAPVRELFAHLSEWRSFHDALAASGRMPDFLELAQGHFARAIAERLRDLPRGRSLPEPQRAAVAFAQAGALLSLLSWWIDHGMAEPPEQMDALYHRMFWNGVETAR